MSENNEPGPRDAHDALLREIEPPAIQASLGIQQRKGSDPIPPPYEGNPETANKLRSLEEALRSMQGPNPYIPTSFADLCFFPEMQLPPKFKMPDFAKFDVTTNPITHLRLFASSLSGYPNPDQMMMQLFQHSLTGQAAQWLARLDLRCFQSWVDLSQEFLRQYRHNAQLTVDRFSLSRVKKEEGESFREYSLRWKDLASQVNPPLQDAEYMQAFVRTLSGIYFERLCTSTGQSFAELIRQGEIIEDGVKQGKIIDPYALVGESSGSVQAKGKAIAKEEEEPEEAAAIILSSQNQSQGQNPYYPVYQTNPSIPYQAYPSLPYSLSAHQAPLSYSSLPYQAPPAQNYPIPPVYLLGFPPAQSQEILHDHQQSHPSPCPQGQSRNQQQAQTPMGISMMELLNRLLLSGHIALQPAKPAPNPLPKSYKAEATCAYHSGQSGHDIEQCRAFKKKVQHFINTGVVRLEEDGIVQHDP